MSYKHLAGRLIETQRSMLGKSALEIARSVEGISVDDDGSVTAVTGDRRAVLETLSQRYMDVLGSAAETRLLAAAREFEDELVLPPTLGGPDDTVDPATADPDGADATATGALSDGGTVSFQPPTGTDAAGVDAVGQTDAEKALQDVASIPEPMKVEYTVTSSIPDATDTDLDSVYLMPLDDDGWQAPISVAEAVTEGLSNATDLGSDGIDAFVDAIDSHRLLATLDDENGETVSFYFEGVTVTFHGSGSLAIH